MIFKTQNTGRNSNLYLMVILFFISLSTFLFAQISHSVNFSESDLNIETFIAQDSNYYQIIDMKNLPKIYEEGKPVLPYITIQMIIPMDQDVDNIETTILYEQEYDVAYKIFPAQNGIVYADDFGENINTGFIKPDPKIYHSDYPWPEKNVDVINNGFFDGNNHIVNIRVCPFQYYPKLKKLIFISSMNIILNFSGPNGAKTVKVKDRSPKTKSFYDNILKKLVVNPKDITKFRPPLKSALEKAAELTSIQTSPLPFYEYVIVTSQYLKNQNVFNDLIKWKKRKGLNIGVVAIEDITNNYTGDPCTPGLNDNAGKLRQYLMEAWQSGITVYALLAGERDKIPIRKGAGDNDTYDDPDHSGVDEYNKIPTDLYFSSFARSSTTENDNWNEDGDGFIGEPEDNIDYYPEIFVGRLICENDGTKVTDINNWIESIKRYEGAIYQSNLNNYLMQQLLVQSDQYQDQFQCAQNISNLTNNWSIISDIQEEYPSATAPLTFNSTDPNLNTPIPSANTILQKINSNFGFIWLFSHSNKYNFNARTGIADVNQLYNKYDREQLISEEPILAWNTNVHPYLLSLQNYSKPTVVFSNGCLHCSFDGYPIPATGIDRKSVSYVFTLRDKRAPVFLGHSRYGNFGGSRDLGKNIINYIFTGTSVRL